MQTNILGRPFIGFAAAALVLAASAAGAQPRYRIVDLGPAAISTCDGPSINAAGHALGRSSATGVTRSYLIDSTGTRTDVGSLFGFDTLGLSIGSADHIVGISARNSQDTAFHAFLWTRTGGIRDLTPGPGSASPCAVNSSGDVVGVIYDTSHGFVHTGGTTYDLNDLAIDGGGPWLYFGKALGINDAGEIFGIGTLSANNQLHGYLLIPTSSGTGNLLVNGGFEQSAPPATGPGWVADSMRQVAAKSETNQPHTGLQNGACWVTDSLDCGMYQDLTAPSTGTYAFTIFANADRTGGFVGANVNGTTVAWQPVDVRGFGNYGAAYTMTFTANQGDSIRVWMYSPAIPGYVVIDDANLMVGQ